MPLSPRRRCGHPEALRLHESVCGWPPGTVVTWCLQATPPLAPEFDAAVAGGIALWSRQTGVDVQRVGDPAQARVVVSFPALDPAGQVLGLTDLPCGSDAAATLQLRLNPAVAWTPSELKMVAAHEFGHALGVGHADQSLAAVMDPYYRPDLAALQPWDVQQGQLRYGPPPAPEPAPPPSSPPPSGGNTVFITFDVPSAGSYVLALACSLTPGPKGPPP